MPGGCWICNPMCGKCQPAPMKSAVCDACGAVNIFQRPDIMERAELLCKKCGLDLTDRIRPKVTRCNYSGLFCAYPCGKSTSPRHDFGDMPCERNTAPSQEWLDAHPTAVKLGKANNTCS